jgi:hypothetical protein
MQVSASWPLPAHVTDSNLLVHWLWIQTEPWCTGKQLPPGFNPMDLLITMFDQSRRPYLPLAFPCTLAMIRKVATMIGPGSQRSLIRMAVWYMNYVAHWSWMRCAAALGIIPGETYREPQASSGKLRAASCKKRFDIYRIFLYKVNAPVFMYPASLNSNMMDQVQRHTPHCAAVFAGCWI